jgi:hypothetical protein
MQRYSCNLFHRALLGGIKEDVPPRWQNHIHDPTKAWDDAG